MVTPRRLIGKIKPKGGRSASERAAMFVARRIRLGRHIRLHQIRTVPENEREKKLFDELSQQQRKERRELESRTGKGFRKKLESLRIKSRILYLSRLLGKEQEGRRPIFHQLLAAEGLQYGLDSPQLLRMATVIKSTWSHNRRQVTWEGTSEIAYNALRMKWNNRNLVSHIENTLFQKNGKFSSKELATVLGLPYTPKSQTAMNASLQLLETMGLVRKLPPMTTPRGEMSVWIHREHPNPPIDYPNSSLDVLFAAFRSKTKGVLATELYYSPKGYGNPAAKYAERAIYNTIQKLKEDGLIDYHKIEVTGLSDRGGGNTKYIEIFLTAEGREYMNEYDSTGTLPEGLRKVLLGEKAAIVSREARKKYAEIGALLDQLIRTKNES